MRCGRVSRDMRVEVCKCNLCMICIATANLLERRCFLVYLGVVSVTLSCYEQVTARARSAVLCRAAQQARTATNRTRRSHYCGDCGVPCAPRPVHAPRPPTTKVKGAPTEDVDANVVRPRPCNTLPAPMLTRGYAVPWRQWCCAVQCPTTAGICRALACGASHDFAPSSVCTLMIFHRYTRNRSTGGKQNVGSLPNRWQRGCVISLPVLRVFATHFHRCGMPALLPLEGVLPQLCAHGSPRSCCVF